MTTKDEAVTVEQLIELLKEEDQQLPVAVQINDKYDYLRGDGIVKFDHDEGIVVFLDGDIQ